MRICFWIACTLILFVLIAAGASAINLYQPNWPFASDVAAARMDVRPENESMLEKVSSMARTTAYTASIAAQMVASGEVKERGIVPSELAFRGHLFSRFMKELDARGIKIQARRLEE